MSTTSPNLMKRLRRTPYQVIASVCMIFITLFVMGIFLLLAASSSAILSYFESKPQLTVFFKDDKDKSSIDAIVEKLRSTGKLASFQYISKDQALAIYKEQNKNDPLLLEMVTADILPASLEITAKSPNFLSDLAFLVKDEKGIDEVVFQKDVVDTLISWTTAIRKVGLVFILLLMLATFFILLTSIGMKIALKKDEIEILQLVGATSFYIKRPFLYEGISYGLSGAFLAAFILTIIILYLQPFIFSFLRGIPTLSLFSYQNITINIWPPSLVFFVLLWGILLISGFFIGLMGSLFAVSRYIKRK
jgi:cell division transport system permease protein